MRLIDLTQGKKTVVDDKDFDFVSRFKWCAVRNKKNWYAVRKINNRSRLETIFLHRVILGLSRGGAGVDHQDGDGLNNTRSNLRIASGSQNQWNRGKQRNNVSGFKGVYYDRVRKQWCSQIAAHGKRHCLGRFETSKEAAGAYDQAAQVFHGDFARTK